MNRTTANPGRSKRRPCLIGHVPGSHSHKPDQPFLPQAGGGQEGVSRGTARCAVPNHLLEWPGCTDPVGRATSPTFSPWSRIPGAACGAPTSLDTRPEATPTWPTHCSSPKLGEARRGCRAQLVVRFQTAPTGMNSTTANPGAQQAAPLHHRTQARPTVPPPAWGGQEGVSCTARCAVSNRTYWMNSATANPRRSKRRPHLIGHASGSHSHKPGILFLPQAGGG